MKILEANDAMLANVEVYEFLRARDPRPGLEKQRAAQKKAARATQPHRQSKSKLHDPKVTLAMLTADVGMLLYSSPVLTPLLTRPCSGAYRY